MNINPLLDIYILQESTFSFFILLFIFYFCYLFFIFWPHHMACGILTPRPGIEPAHPALAALTTRGVPRFAVFIFWCEVLNLNVVQLNLFLLLSLILFWVLFNKILPISSKVLKWFSCAFFQKLYCLIFFIGCIN